MNVAKILSIALIVGAGAWSPALAQSLPNSTMLAGGSGATRGEIARAKLADLRGQCASRSWLTEQQQSKIGAACVKKAYAPVEA
jgi:hypothetical protein